jgi:drug/metabolite transporter (DMT)-like permease
MSLIIFVGFYLSNKSVQKGRVGIVLPITSSRIILTTILAAVFLKEELTITQYGLIFMIICGIVILSVNFKELKTFSFSGKGIKEAIWAAVIFGVVMTFYGSIAKVLGPYLIGVMVEGVILIGCIMQLKYMGKQLTLTTEEWKTYGKSLVAIMILSIIGVYFSNMAYIQGSTSIVTAISAAAPIVTTIYASYVHKEMLNFQENIGMMVIFAGIIVLSSF